MVNIGANSLVMNGPGLWLLTATNTYTNSTAINGGTLQLGNGTTRNGSVAGNITDNAVLVLANPYAQTYGGSIMGAGTLTVIGLRRPDAFRGEQLHWHHHHQRRHAGVKRLPVPSATHP